MPKLDVENQLESNSVLLATTSSAFLSQQISTSHQLQPAETEGIIFTEMTLNDAFESRF